MIKYLLFFFLFFGLHYIEGLPPVGPFSVAQLWKIPLLAYFVVLCVKNRKRERFETVGYWYSAEAFLCPAVFANFLSVVQFAMKQLPLVLAFGAFKNKWGRNVRLLEKILYAYAQFVCLASVVTLSGLVEPLRDMKSAEAYLEGMEYQASVFTAPHAASSYFVVAILVLMTGFVMKKFRTRTSRLFNAALLVVALVSLFEAYVRTGWLMLLVALVMYVDFRRITRRRLVVYFVSAALISAGLVWFYQSNEAFRLRVAGENRYSAHDGTELIDTEGSGRDHFWKNGIEQWSKNDIYGLFFGKGYDAVVEDNYRATGLHVFSHNHFVDSLSQYGLVSLLLLIAFYVVLYGFIRRKCCYSPYYPLCRSVFFASVVFSFFQNQMYFDYAMMFALILCLARATDKRFETVLSKSRRNDTFSYVRGNMGKL